MMNTVKVVKRIGVAVGGILIGVLFVFGSSWYHPGNSSNIALANSTNTYHSKWQQIEWLQLGYKDSSYDGIVHPSLNLGPSKWAVDTTVCIGSATKSDGTCTVSSVVPTTIHEVWTVSQWSDLKRCDMDGSNSCADLGPTGGVKSSSIDNYLTFVTSKTTSGDLSKISLFPTASATGEYSALLKVPGTSYGSSFGRINGTLSYGWSFLSQVPLEWTIDGTVTNP